MSALHLGFIVTSSLASGSLGSFLRLVFTLYSVLQNDCVTTSFCTSSKPGVVSQLQEPVFVPSISMILSLSLYYVSVINFVRSFSVLFRNIELLPLSTIFENLLLLIEFSLVLQRCIL